MRARCAVARCGARFTVPQGPGGTRWMGQWQRPAAYLRTLPPPRPVTREAGGDARPYGKRDACRHTRNRGRDRSRAASVAAACGRHRRCRAPLQGTLAAGVPTHNKAAQLSCALSVGRASRVPDRAASRADGDRSGPTVAACAPHCSVRRRLRGLTSRGRPGDTRAGRWWPARAHSCRKAPPAAGYILCRSGEPARRPATRR